MISNGSIVFINFNTADNPVLFAGINGFIQVVNLSQLQAVFAIDHANNAQKPTIYITAAHEQFLHIAKTPTTIYRAGPLSTPAYPLPLYHRVEPVVLFPACVF